MTTIKNLRQRIKDQETIASQIKSVEKRFRFQSQFYYTFRSCITTCTCKRRMCYYCKSNSHPGISCAQNQARSPHVGQVNACPQCGIAIVKHDGCSSVKCVCGHTFQWRKDYRFFNNEGRRHPAAIGTRVSGWIRSENGWTRIIGASVDPAPTTVVQREERWFERGMPLETFESNRNRLATLYDRVLERYGIRLRSQTRHFRSPSITRSFPRSPPDPQRKVKAGQPPPPPAPIVQPQGVHSSSNPQRSPAQTRSRMARSESPVRSLSITRSFHDRRQTSASATKSRTTTFSTSTKSCNVNKPLPSGSEYCFAAAKCLATCNDKRSKAKCNFRHRYQFCWYCIRHL